MEIDIKEMKTVLEDRLKNVDFTCEYSEIGTVVKIGDGVAQVYGLTNIQAGELVEFEHGEKGLALNLEEYSVGIVIFGDTRNIEEGTKVKRTNKIASINVGEGFLGRVVDTFGKPIDGKGNILGETYELPLEIFLVRRMNCP